MQSTCKSAPFAPSRAIITCRSPHTIVVFSLFQNAARRQFVEITFFFFAKRCKTRQVITIIIFWSGKKRRKNCRWCYVQGPLKEPLPPFVILIRLWNSPHNNVKVIYEHCSGAVCFWFFFSVLRFSLWIFMFRVTKSLFMSFHYIKGKMGPSSRVSGEEAAENWRIVTRGRGSRRCLEFSTLFFI